MYKVMRGVLVVAVAGVALTAPGAARAGSLGGASAARVAARLLTVSGSARPAALPGTRLWVARYGGPGSGLASAASVAVSPVRGTVFVTGYSWRAASEYDFATVAYSPVSGARLWVKRYDGPGNGYDEATSVAVSPDGDRVFVTGYTSATTSSNYYPATQDYATVAYDAVTGARLWTARYDGPGNRLDSAASVAVSPGGGRVFVTGRSSGTTSGADYATVAYSAATGARLWTARYNGPRDGDDVASSVAVGPGGGRVFVTGGSGKNSSGRDYATVAYSAATGRRLWVQRYSGGRNDFGASAVAVSPAGGTVFVTGASGRDYATVAYRATTGAQLWVKRYSGPGNGYSQATSVAVGPGGATVFVTGGSEGTTSYDYATVAYRAATGARLWVRRYNGPVNGGGGAASVAVGRGGARVFVTGSIQQRTLFDYATVAYNAATGARLWVRQYNGPGDSGDEAASVAVSPGGSRVFVTGRSGEDYATVAYSR